MAPGTADEPDILAQTDARDLARDERRRDPQPRGEEMRLLGIGDERREQLTLRERLRRAGRGGGLCAERGRSQGAEPEHDGQQGGPARDPARYRGAIARSEERRVGKECRSRWSAYH